MTLPTVQEFKNTLRQALSAEQTSSTLTACDMDLFGRHNAILCRSRNYDADCANLFKDLCFARIEKIVKNSELYAEYRKGHEFLCPEEQYLLEKFVRERKRFKDVNVLIQELRRLKTKFGATPGDVDDYVPDQEDGDA